MALVEDAALVELQWWDHSVTRLEDPTAISAGSGRLGLCPRAQTHSQLAGADPRPARPPAAARDPCRPPVPLGAAAGPLPLPAPRVRSGAARPLPKSHLLKISWQTEDEEKHGVGEGVGLAVAGGREGPWQDGCWGVATFQWPDISEQEAATAPPGKRHSSFLSLVQVPGVGGGQASGQPGTPTHGLQGP